MMPKTTQTQLRRRRRASRPRDGGTTPTEEDSGGQKATYTPPRAPFCFSLYFLASEDRIASGTTRKWNVPAVLRTLCYHMYMSSDFCLSLAGHVYAACKYHMLYFCLLS